MPNAILVTDLDGRILLFNRSCEESTGFRREEVVGKHVFEFFAPRDRRHFIQSCLPTIQNCSPDTSPAGTSRLRPPRPIPCCVRGSAWTTKSGKERLIRWRFSTLTLEDGKRCLLGTGIDAGKSRQPQEQAAQQSAPSQANHGQPVGLTGKIQDPPAIGSPPSQTSFIGESLVARNVLTLARKLSVLDSTALITGESGVGKGLIARIIHQSGPRAKGPFITVSCTGLPSELVESELFGHERGAYTGAHEKRLGRVEHANGGTLFLDEVGDLPLELQPKLLNFLQDRTFTRLGSSKTIFVDVRIVAATNQDLQALCKQRRFRADLYFRLNVLPIQIQPLRDRKEDIPALIDHTLKRICRHRQCPPFMVTDDAMEALLRYDWPGNVRELENVLERSTAFCSDMTITRNDLPPEVIHKPAVGAADMLLDGLPLAEVERIAILRTLELCGG
ncbi:MAG: sigma 54-interacting transcriptional regulator, partial [Acidobacteria bacterium]|nr:sigma 54-interacting transcriptional regulator [Acidobacteriota bacterium]